MDQWEETRGEIRRETLRLEELEDNYRQAKERLEIEQEQLTNFRIGLVNKLEGKYDALLSDVKRMAGMDEIAIRQITNTFQNYLEVNEEIFRDHWRDLEDRNEELEKSYHRDYGRQEERLEELYTKLRNIDPEDGW